MRGACRIYDRAQIGRCRCGLRGMQRRWERVLAENDGVKYDGGPCGAAGVGVRA